MIFWVSKQVLSNTRKHDFTGQCQLCHSKIPVQGTDFQDIPLKDNVDRLCARCHTLSGKTSHPTGVRPQNRIPLQEYLGKEGELTCITCHDVHKEEKVRRGGGQQETTGLLRGHVRGRMFCFTCHNEKRLGASWRHNSGITYAHWSGKLTQSSQGEPLDKFSIECLSCHDGAISSMAGTKVRGGNFKHGSGGHTHPIGVEYPRNNFKNDFVPVSSLPPEIKLFDGSVGCLSCHNPYGKEKSMLVINNRGSALCLACHRK